MKSVVCQGSNAEVDKSLKWKRCDDCHHIIACVNGVMRKHWWSNKAHRRKRGKSDG